MHWKLRTSYTLNLTKTADDAYLSPKLVIDDTKKLKIGNGTLNVGNGTSIEVNSGGSIFLKAPAASAEDQTTQTHAALNNLGTITCNANASLINKEV